MGSDKKMTATSAVSPRLMQMKFMQRRQETDIQEKLLEEKRKADDALHWHVTYEAFNQSSDRVEVIPGQTFLASSLQFGRQSYRNFNKPIEEAMQEKQRRHACSLAEKTEKANNISENELALRYEQFVGKAKRQIQLDQQQSSRGIVKGIRPSENRTIEMDLVKKRPHGSSMADKGSSLRGLLKK